MVAADPEGIEIVVLFRLSVLKEQVTLLLKQM